MALQFFFAGLSKADLDRRYLSARCFSTGLHVFESYSFAHKVHRLTQDVSALALMNRGVSAFHNVLDLWTMAILSSRLSLWCNRRVDGHRNFGSLIR